MKNIMERVQMKGVRCFENNYQPLPIGTKGYVNFGGTIYAAKVTGRAIRKGATDFWVHVFDVWSLPNGEEFLTLMGCKRKIQYGDEWVSVANTIEGAKVNKEGEFAPKTIDTMEYLSEKYGVTENNFQCNRLVLYKLVNGFAKKYEATYDIMFVGDELVITIPDIENGIGFLTDDECRNSHKFAIVEFDENETATENCNDDEIEFKVTAKKRDLAFLKEIGLKIKY